MPKLKTSSSAKKRFKITASGRIGTTPTGKNHFRRNKSKSFLRNSRRTKILCIENEKFLKKRFLHC